MVDPLVQFNSMMRAAEKMVRRLATGSGSNTITTGVSLPEVKAFQAEWNRAKDVAAAEIDSLIYENTGNHFDPEPHVRRVVDQGLVTDGKYGTNTAIALLLALWARMYQWGEANGIPSALTRIPANPRYWPEVWANDREFWSEVLTEVAVNEEQDPIPSSPDPVPEPPPQVIDEAEPGDQTPIEPNEPVPPTAPIDFDPEVVEGRTKGTASSTGLWVALGALAIGGGLVFYSARKGMA